MKMQALMCHQCGAPLDVPACKDIVTCLYCSAQIYIRESPPAGSSTSQAVRRQLALKQADPEIARLLDELEQLDREWSDYRSRYLRRDEKGSYHVPDEETCWWGAGIVGVLGAPLVVWSCTRGEPWWIVLVEVLIIAITIFACFGSARIARIYRRSLRNYTHERTRLNQQLRERGWDETAW